MLRAILTAALLSLTACSASIDAWEINQAETLCNNRGGVDYIDLINMRAVCADGARLVIKAPS